MALFKSTCSGPGKKKKSFTQDPFPTENNLSEKR